MTDRLKYPRTPHLPWSPGAGGDDTVLGSARQFAGQEVIVTEKLDGENTTLYRRGLHARSLDPRPHPSRDWVKGLQGRLGYLIPADWRVCGENLYARHSLAYDELESYFYLFSVWDDSNTALSWDETLDWAATLGLPTPRQLWRGPWDEAAVRAVTFDAALVEGYVVRTVAGFAHADFQQHIAKYVRQGHVQTDQHWMHAAVVPNRLKGESEP
ncbi:RNA ligase family protein [Deinococcus sp.]|uniref:RNA ligase family protein n=1 Tax=Deinococcus sp. TaxID=47478 RepID=UPI0025D43C71|nr:RNA ligase family protein [Deinococcus sp.]